MNEIVWLMKFFVVVWVGSGRPPLGLVNFPLKIPNYSTFFPLDKKNTRDKERPASYLLEVKSMFGLGREQSLLLCPI